MPNSGTNSQVRPHASTRGTWSPLVLLVPGWCFFSRFPQGNHYNTPGGNNSNSGSSYHYSNQDRSYYYKNDNGSTYYSSPGGHGTYTPPKK